MLVEKGVKISYRSVSLKTVSRKYDLAIISEVRQHAFVVASIEAR
jgi:hypothetical protein